MELMAAKFYSVSPEEVEQWTNADFLDRQEFMLMYQSMENEHPQ